MKETEIRVMVGKMKKAAHCLVCHGDIAIGEAALLAFAADGAAFAGACRACWPSAEAPFLTAFENSRPGYGRALIGGEPRFREMIREAVSAYEEAKPGKGGRG